MAARRPIDIRFEYDSRHDLYFAYPCCTLSCEADCKDFYDAFASQFAPLERRVDMVIVMDMFDIDDALHATWSRYRNAFHGKFTRHSVRVFLGEHHAWVGTFPTHRDCTPDIESAIQVIEARRRGARTPQVVRR